MQTYQLRQPVRLVILVFLAAFAAACGGGEGPPDGAASAQADAGATTADGLTQDELRYGIGPIRNLQLGDVEPELAEEGAEIFTTKCSACHKIDERYVGPPLRGVTERRTPEFVMNMILNPDSMIARHPIIKELLAQFYTPMPDQQLTEEDARAVLEYLRAPGTVESVEVEAEEAEDETDGDGGGN